MARTYDLGHRWGPEHRYLTLKRGQTVYLDHPHNYGPRLVVKNRNGRIVFYAYLDFVMEVGEVNTSAEPPNRIV